MKWIDFEIEYCDIATAFVLWILKTSFKKFWKYVFLGKKIFFIDQDQYQDVVDKKNNWEL